METELKKKKVRIPDKTDMDTETPMNGWAIDAEKDPIRNRRPRRILGIAIETHLRNYKLKKKFKIEDPLTEIPDLKQKFKKYIEI